MRISDWSSDVCSSDLLPANIDITNFSVQAGEQSLAVFSRHDLEKKAKNRAMWTQIGIAALGGLAAAGAATQRDTYRTSFYRSEEHTSELKSILSKPYAIFGLNKKHRTNTARSHNHN